MKAKLTSKNKSKLPDNSNPGVYKIPCSKHPINPYIGETKIQIRNRNEQHEDYIKKEQWDRSGVAFHGKTCEGPMLWSKTETIKVERNRFDRKVREALEIQYHKCGPKDGGMNLDMGQYVKTLFWTPFFTHLRKTSEKTLTSARSPSSEANAMQVRNTLALTN